MGDSWITGQYEVSQLFKVYLYFPTEVVHADSDLKERHSMPSIPNRKRAFSMNGFETVLNFNNYNKHAEESMIHVCK